MGKRIIQQARGHASLTYRVRKRAYRYKIGYPALEGKGKVLELINSAGHSAPLVKVRVEKDGKAEVFYNVACERIFVGQEIELGGRIGKGNIVRLKDVPSGSNVCNIEVRPGDGGRLVRGAGSSAVVVKKAKGKVCVLMPSKKEVWFNEACRVTLGVVAGHGILDKPVVKAGKKFYIMRSRGKLWPRTSAVKMNAVDHKFGSGRGKRIKSKITKKNAPPGAKVGLLLPKRTGRRKR